MHPLPDLNNHQASVAAMHYVIAAATEAAAMPLKAPVLRASAPAATDTPSKAPPSHPVAFAEPTRLLYDLRAGDNTPLSASGELLWQADATQYSARLDMSAFGFRLRTWISKGALGPGGLQPTLFRDQPRGPELSTTFQRGKGIITFSENTLEVPLQPGAQDKLSALLQLSALAAGAPERYTAGSSIRFQAADAHRAELWNFKVGNMETLDLPGGTLSALKFTKEPTVDFDQRIEVWLTPTLQYLPARLRITEANGTFADLVWRKSQKPE